MEDTTRSRYRIEVLANGLQVLELLERGGDFTLRQISDSVGLTRSAAFRILATLEERGWVRQTRRGRYERRLRRALRIGHAMEYGAQVFSQLVAAGIKAAAERAGVELLVRDNEFDAEVALANARYFIDQKVDAVIEFQGVEKVAPVIGHLFAEAGIPCIALEIPQPGAVFFGANNYYAGLLGGRVLGSAAQERWNGRFDRLILVEERQTGPFVQSRMQGTIDEIEEIVGKLAHNAVTRVDGQGTSEHGAQVVRELAAQISPDERLLLTAQNEPSLLGALDALRESGIPSDNVIAVIQAATREGCRTMLWDASPVAACIGYFPERYGEAVIPALLEWLDGKQPAPALYTQHVVIDRSNLSEHYPDELAGSASTREADEARL